MKEIAWLPGSSRREVDVTFKVTAVPKFVNCRYAVPVNVARKYLTIVVGDVTVLKLALVDMPVPPPEELVCNTMSIMSSVACATTAVTQ